MRQREIKRWCAGVAVLAGVAACVTVIAGWWLPLRLPQPQAEISRGTLAVGSDRLADTAPSREELLQLAGKNLRPPLFDPPPPPPAAPPPPAPKPPLNLRLLGTIAERDGSCAILDVGNNTTELHRLGAVLKTPAGDATLVAITPSEVVVERSGERTVLKLEQPAP